MKVVLGSKNKDKIKIDKNELRKIKWVKYEDIKNYFNFPRQLGLTDKIRDLNPSRQTS